MSKRSPHLWWWSVKFEPAFSVQGYSLLAMARLVHTSTIRVLWINGVGEERTPIHGVAGCGWRSDHIVVRGLEKSRSAANMMNKQSPT